MKNGLNVVIDKTDAVLEALRQLGNREVLVGIPEEASGRDDVPFGNAGIGYLNEYGSPAQNIPPRPHLVPGVRSVDSQTLPELKEAAHAVLSGETSQAERHLNRAGILAAGGVKKFIDASGFTPLADSTVAARARRGRKGALQQLERRRAGEAPSTEGAKPLVDTGNYRNAITYVVRDKNAAD